VVHVRRRANVLRWRVRAVRLPLRVLRFIERVPRRVVQLHLRSGCLLRWLRIRMDGSSGWRQDQQQLHWIASLRRFSSPRRILEPIPLPWEFV
jgi:hypothetical protein